MSEDEHSDAHDADSEGSSDSSGLFGFDVVQRQGYDKIIETISGGGQHQDDFAEQVCSHLEIFESLTPGRFVARARVLSAHTLTERLNTFRLLFASTGKGLVI